MRALLVVTSLALAVAAAPLHAQLQRPAEVKPYGLQLARKVRVRTHSFPAAPLVGRLVGERGDSLLLDMGYGSPVAIGRDDVVAIEEKRPNPLRETTATIGALGGLAAGTYLAVKLCEGKEDCWFHLEKNGEDEDNDGEPDEVLNWGPGSATVLATTIVGGLLGAVVAPDRWHRIGGHALAPVKMSVTAARKSAGFALSIPFGGRREPRE